MGKRTNRSDQRRSVLRRNLRLERLTDRRVLASISGAVFEDLNFSLQQDPGEPNAPSRVVYLDLNQNGQLETTEPLALAGTDGNFVFENLADGTYSVRLYNGTDTQVQTVPILADSPTSAIEVLGGSHVVSRGPATTGGSLVLTDGGLVQVDLATGLTTPISIGDGLVDFQTLPDGRVLVVGDDPATPTSWIVDPATSLVTPVDVSGGAASTGYATVAIDGNGRGVLIPATDSAAEVPVIAVDASDAETEIQITVTSTLVPAQTQVLSSATGTRSVFASATVDGLALSQWSNLTASLITTSPIVVTGTTELLAFDDASGLVALRTASGGVSVHDVNGNFATLHTLQNVPGPVLIDGARDLLFALSPADAAMKLVNLQSGQLIADLAVDLSAVGEVAAIALGGAPGQHNQPVVVLGAAGVAEVKLNRPDARRVTVVGGQDVGDVLFGIAEIGENSAPQYDSLPVLETLEDVPLVRNAPGSRVGSIDVDGSNYLVIQRTAAENGTATFRIDGSIQYFPDADFNGTDSVSVVLHDGQDLSDPVALSIEVTPVPDPPTSINIDIDPVPEDIGIGTPIGVVEIIDIDGIDHRIDVDDPRFGAVGGDIIFIGGEINFEDERSFPLKVTVTDTGTDDVYEETFTVNVLDRNDPITGITPTTAFVFENAPGDIVTELNVLDQDEEQFHTLTVDNDPRFVIDGFDLRLAEGVSLDFETEETVLVDVTATEVGGSGTFTQTITIRVQDLPEQPLGIALAPATVLEFTEGDTVGEITLDGSALDGRFILTVDDSRFTIEGNTLKLVDDQFVQRSEQSQIQVTITAADSQDQFTPVSDTFVIEVLENETPAHNRDNPFDVNHGGDVTAADALAIINYLNTFGPGPVGSGSLEMCYDVNADGFITALDALLVLNELNRISRDGTVGGEGERAGDLPIRRDTDAVQNPGLAGPLGSGGSGSGGSGSGSSGADDSDLGGEIGGSGGGDGRDNIFGNWASFNGNTTGRSGSSPAGSPGDPTEGSGSAGSKSLDAGIDATLGLFSDDSSGNA